MAGLYRYLIPVVLFLLLFHMETGGVNLPDTNQDNPPDPPQFSDNNPEEIRIGMLLPASTDRDPLAKAARDGAELAVLTANQQGGYNGRPFRLIIRTADGLWGAGSKESVKFVHEDQVVAMITALDGRNAHLAEQVAAKSHVVQLSTRATDETLSQAFVPWFFRIVPNDKQQAEAMINEIFQSRGMQIVYAWPMKISLIANMGAESFKKVCQKKAAFQLEGVQLTIRPPGIEDGYFPIMNDAEAHCHFRHPMIPPFRWWKKSANHHPDIQVFGSLCHDLRRPDRVRILPEDVMGEFLFPPGSVILLRDSTSRSCLSTGIGQMPSPAASYAYDGTNLIIEAVRLAGPEREKIRDVLRDIKFESWGYRHDRRSIASGNRISLRIFDPDDQGPPGDSQSMHP
jgi:hypothetical protein